MYMLALCLYNCLLARSLSGGIMVVMYIEYILASARISTKDYDIGLEVVREKSGL